MTWRTRSAVWRAVAVRSRHLAQRRDRRTSARGSSAVGSAPSGVRRAPSRALGLAPGRDHGDRALPRVWHLMSVGLPGGRGRLRGPGGHPLRRRRARPVLRAHLAGQLELPPVPGARRGRLLLLRSLRRRRAARVGRLQRRHRAASRSSSRGRSTGGGSPARRARVALSGYAVMLGRMALLDSTLTFFFTLTLLAFAKWMRTGSRAWFLCFAATRVAHDPGEGDGCAGAADRAASICWSRASSARLQPARPRAGRARLLAVPDPRLRSRPRSNSDQFFQFLHDCSARVTHVPWHYYLDKLGHFNGYPLLVDLGARDRRRAEAATDRGPAAAGLRASCWACSSRPIRSRRSTTCCPRFRCCRFSAPAGCTGCRPARSARIRRHRRFATAGGAAPRLIAPIAAAL